MGILDIILMIAILAGALWLLHNSLWKKKGCCQECSGGGCAKK